MDLTHMLQGYFTVYCCAIEAVLKDMGKWIKLYCYNQQKTKGNKMLHILHDEL